MKHLNPVKMLMITTLIAVGCTSLDKQVDQKLKDVQPTQSREDLNREAMQDIAKATELSSEQRAQLVTLREKVRNDITSLQNDSLKLRALLIQEVLTPGYNSDEVEVIKNRMKHIEQRRLTVLFEWVDQANRIIGRTNMKGKGPMFFELFDHPFVETRP